MSRRSRQYPEGYTRQGLLNLDRPNWREARQPDKKSAAPAPPATSEALVTENVTDLLYTGEETNNVSDKVRRQFPSASLKAVWDEIHDYRVEVEMPGVSRRDWYKWLIQEGLAGFSFHFHLDVNFHPRAVMALVNEVSAAK